MTPTFHKLKISDIRQEANDTVSIAFEIPEELKSDYAYVSGQYLTLRTMLDEENIRRSYSLCSAPHENEWRVAIKKVENGKFSTFANEKLKVGEAIEVMTPAGLFQVDLNPNNNKSYILFAAGSGITPIISIVKSVLKYEPESNVTLFYGNKNFSSIIFREELEALKNENMEKFRLIHVLSRESLGNQIQKGRIDAQKCLDLEKAFLNVEKNNLANCETFVCGPEKMILAVKEAMTNFGVPKNQIHFELFGTSTKKNKIIIKETKISANVTIIIDGDETKIALDSDSDNILDAGQKAGADLPFACKGGVCCTCKAKILEGSARMDVNYALEQDELDAGYILTCQAHPTSEKLVVSFDD
jgi:ring-1,2-phenylacetyl-CoA epoxidase subunit PaaE